MDDQAIFGLQFFLSLVAWGVTVGFVLGPWLAEKSRHQALLWLSLPHAFRHIGMVFLVPGVVAEPLPAGFAGPAAYGDLATGVLATLAIIALRSRWSAAISLTWLFNVLGTLDLANALRHTDVAPLFGAAWYIPTMLVPLLLVTHFLMFRRLLARA
jgi:hypothetical protein